MVFVFVLSVVVVGDFGIPPSLFFSAAVAAAAVVVVVDGGGGVVVVGGVPVAVAVNCSNLVVN